MAPKQGLLDQNTLITGNNPIIDVRRGDVFYMDATINQSITFDNVYMGRTIIIIVNNTTGGLITCTFPGAKVNSNYSGEVAANSETLFTIVFSHGNFYVTEIAELT